MNDYKTDSAIRNNPSLHGRAAYEASLAAVPTYHDGTPRKPWDALGDVERWSWERTPIMHTWNRTDRFYIRTDRMGGVEIASATEAKSVYLQPGDDASRFMFRAERIEKCFRVEDQDRALDRLCEPYADVMTFDEAAAR